MKQTRMIRISFLLCAVFAVAAFWSGFYFGENSTQPEQILTASEEKANVTEKEYTKPDILPDTDTAQEADNETVESMKDVRQAKYYLKQADEYLAVYRSDTDSLYFETDLKLTDLPSDMQEEALAGIPFSDLSEVYSFLENYSS